MDQTTLNLKFLTALRACNTAKDFIKRNNLETFPISMLDQIQGEYDGWVSWIKNTLKAERREFNTNGSIIHYKNSYGFENWQEYDSNNNLIHYKDSNGYEYWQEYDSNGNMIHYKNSYGFEYWQEYDSNNNMVHYKDSNGYEYWQEYYYNEKQIIVKSSTGIQEWREFDSNGNTIHIKGPYGLERQYLTEYYSNGQLKRYCDMILPNLSP